MVQAGGGQCGGEPPAIGITLCGRCHSHEKSCFHHTADRGLGRCWADRRCFFSRVAGRDRAVRRSRAGRVLPAPTPVRLHRRRHLLGLDRAGVRLGVGPGSKESTELFVWPDAAEPCADPGRDLACRVFGLGPARIARPDDRFGDAAVERPTRVDAHRGASWSSRSRSWPRPRYAWPSRSSS